MRVLACGLVIYNHLPGYTLYMDSEGWTQGIYMFLSMITRINVPLFFMISGALLLSKSEDFITVIKKRVIRFCLIIAVFQFAVCVDDYINALRWGNPYFLSVKQFIYDLLTNGNNATGAYWYLYAYLGFLFMLPFMQRVVRGMQKQDFYVLLLLHFLISSLIPMVNILFMMTGNSVIKITGYFSVPFAMTKVFFYSLIGFYLEYHVNIREISRKKMTGLCLGAVIGILLSCLCTLYEGKTTGIYTQNYVELFDYVSAMAAFIVIKYIVIVAVPQLSEGKLSKVVCRMGSCTLGIYLLDPHLRYLFWMQYNAKMSLHFPAFWISVGWCVISMALCGIVTLILKRMPVFRKLL